MIINLIINSINYKYVPTEETLIRIYERAKVALEMIL